MTALLESNLITAQIIEAVRTHFETDPTLSSESLAIAVSCPTSIPSRLVDELALLVEQYDAEARWGPQSTRINSAGTVLVESVLMFHRRPALIEFTETPVSGEVFLQALRDVAAKPEFINLGRQYRCEPEFAVRGTVPSEWGQFLRENPSVWGVIHYPDHLDNVVRFTIGHSAFDPHRQPGPQSGSDTPVASAQH